MTAARTTKAGSGTIPSGRFGRHLVDRIEERDVDLMLLEEIATEVGFQRLVAAVALDPSVEWKFADPHHSGNRFFLRPPHDDLGAARAETSARDLPVFTVIYDANHPTHSKLAFSLGYFMGYQTNRRLMDQHFVAAVGASGDTAFGALVPVDDTLELCLWVVLTPQEGIRRREGVYANSKEGLKRVRAVVAETTTAR